jgi:hypothetical protein
LADPRRPDRQGWQNGKVENAMPGGFKKPAIFREKKGAGFADGRI